MINKAVVNEFSTQHYINMYVIMVIELFCLRISQCPDKPCLNENVLVAALPSRLKQY